MRFWASRLAVALFVVTFLAAFKIEIKNGKLNITPPPRSRVPAKTAEPRPITITAPTPAAAAKPAADPAVKGGVCNAESSVGLCYLFVGEKNAEKQTASGNQMACQLFKGQLSKSGPCPPDNRLGRCTIQAGKPDAYVLIYYKKGTRDAAVAKTDCLDKNSSIHAGHAGTWQ